MAEDQASPSLSEVEGHVQTIQAIDNRDMTKNGRKGETFKHITSLSKHCQQCNNMIKLEKTYHLASVVDSLSPHRRYFIDQREEIDLELWNIEAKEENWTPEKASLYEKSNTYYTHLSDKSSHTKSSLISRFHDDSRMINDPDPDHNANTLKRGILYVLVYTLLDVIQISEELQNFARNTQKQSSEALNFAMSKMSKFVKTYAAVVKMSEKTLNMIERKITNELQMVLSADSSNQELYYIGFTNHGNMGISKYLWETEPKGNFWSCVKDAFLCYKIYYAFLYQPGSTSTEYDLIEWAKNNIPKEKLLNGPNKHGKHDKEGIVYVLVYHPKKIPQEVKSLWNDEFPAEEAVNIGDAHGVKNPKELNDFLRKHSISLIRKLGLE